MRVQRHFTVFKLESIFQSFAGQELVNLRYQLMRLFESGEEPNKSEITSESKCGRIRRSTQIPGKAQCIERF